MDLDWSPEERALRAELRALVDEMLPPTWGHADRDLATEESKDFSAQFCAEAARRGLLTPAWPEDVGGRGATLWDQLVVSEELWGSGEPRGPQYMGVNWIGPALMAVGTPEQRREHLPPIAAGRSLWCQGFSEPDAGSDLAALRTRAVREGDVYVVNGQKVWTSYAHTAQHCFLLARTGSGDDPRQGITVLLVPMDTPGIEVRDIPSLAEHLIHEIFFTDVVVPVSCRLGDEGGAWSLIRTVLANERFGAARHEHGSRMLDAIVEEARDLDQELHPSDWEVLGRVAAAVEATRLLNYAAVDAAVRGAQDAGATTSVYRAQVGLMEHLLADVFVDVLGPEALVRESRGDMQQTMATTSTIAAGSLEVHLNAVARAGLGLPKAT